MIILVICISFLFGDPAIIKVNTNVQRIEKYKVVSCGRETVNIGFGYHRIKVMDVDLRGSYLDNKNKFYQMYDIVSQTYFNVKYYYEKGGIVMFITSPGKSYVISNGQCQ